MRRRPAYPNVCGDRARDAALCLSSHIRRALAAGVALSIVRWSGHWRLFLAWWLAGDNAADRLRHTDDGAARDAEVERCGQADFAAGTETIGAREVVGDVEIPVGGNGRGNVHRLAPDIRTCAYHNRDRGGHVRAAVVHDHYGAADRAAIRVAGAVSVDIHGNIRAFLPIRVVGTADVLDADDVGAPRHVEVERCGQVASAAEGGAGTLSRIVAQEAVGDGDRPWSDGNGSGNVHRVDPDRRSCG